jgi:hypothetical protein
MDKQLVCYVAQNLHTFWPKAAKIVQNHTKNQGG